MLRLILFLLVFCSLYGLLNFYAFLKVKKALAPGVWPSTVLLLFMAIMVASPILTRTASRLGVEPIASVFAYLGYTWMGALFLFVSAFFLLDLYHLLVSLAGWVTSASLSPLILPTRQAFFVILVLCVLATTYSYFEALRIQADTLVIKTPKLPKEVGRLRIAQISDVHLGIIVQRERLKRILDKVKEAGPDILVSTGDLLDGQIADISGLGGMLRGVNPRFGKFAVTGNHEFYVGLEHSLEFTKEAGFTVLRGEAVEVEGGIILAGVDDAALSRRTPRETVSEEAVLSEIPGNKFKILLKHRPVVRKDSVGRFDLQLSGHTHNGQLLPFKVFSRLFYPYNSGLTDLGKGSLIYVNRGSGTWGPPMRLLAPPEVTVIDLVRGD
ncbi:MAG: metallophosphoesterase [Deltaproteobacteria bacterium]|nr:metallophosphoesterase [Deltaproteobacteria bacterium]